MSRNAKERSAARELQATLGCSYSTALKKVRDAEALRKAQVNLATEHMTPIEVVMATGKEGEK